MIRERKILLASIVFAIVGWLTAATLATSVGGYKLRVVDAEESAATWKRQAGKTYSELLKAKANTGSTSTLIPVGARIDCAVSTTLVDNKMFNNCIGGTIYPPLDY